MKIFMSALVCATVLHAAVLAAKPKEPEWHSILECKDIKTGKLVVSEKSMNQYNFQSPTYARIYDTTTGSYVFVFSMGADVICTFMDKETYQKRR